MPFRFFTSRLLIFIFAAITFSDLAHAHIRDRLRFGMVGAHQGEVFHFDANTLKRFKQVAKTGLEIIELDLRVSKDGVPMVFHDKTLNRMTKCSGPFSEKTQYELQNSCRFTFNHETMPTFEDVLKWSQGQIIINAEFKDLNVIAPAIALVKKYDAYDWVYFQAQGSPEKYAEARRLDSQIPLLIAAHSQETFDWALSLNDDNVVIIELGKEIHTLENVDAIHKAGKFASEDSWRYNGKWQELLHATCTPLFKKGIDIAITNRAAGCIKQRDRLISSIKN